MDAFAHRRYFSPNAEPDDASLNLWPADNRRDKAFLWIYGPEHHTADATPSIVPTIVGRNELNACHVPFFRVPGTPNGSGYMTVDDFEVAFRVRVSKPKKIPYLKKIPKQNT